MALVTLEGSEVCVDRYEASLQGWSFSHPLDGTDAGAMHVVAAKGVKPQVNVSEEQAEAACEASSKRPCTSREWLAACRGPKDFTYPYGNEPIEGACNVGRPRPQVAIAGAEGGRIDDPKIAEADHTIEPCGSFPKCVSAFGVFDMHGNVHEWVSDDGSPSDPRFGMFLGGYFADGSENGAGCMYKTTAHFKSYHDYSTGFRCCRDAAR
jgi:formylglycine-generating enzyme required for sulfatase activity